MTSTCLDLKTSVKSKRTEMGIVAHTSSPSTKEAERDLQGSLGQPEPPLVWEVLSEV